MNAAPLLDGATAQVLAFEWLAERRSPRVRTASAASPDLRPFAPGQESAATARARTIAAVAARRRRSALDALRAALRGVPDASGAIARAAMGDVLGDADFFELLRFCDADRLVDALIGERTGRGARRRRTGARDAGGAGARAQRKLRLLSAPMRSPAAERGARGAAARCRRNSTPLASAGCETSPGSWTATTLPTSL